MEKSQAMVYWTDGKSARALPLDGKKSFGLKQLQDIVGGTIDIHGLPKSKKVMIVNEEGKLIGLEINKEASRIWRENYPIEKYPYNNDGIIVGAVLVCDRKMIR